LSGFAINSRSDPRSLPDETLPQALLRLLREIIVELLRLLSRLLAGLADFIESPSLGRADRAAALELDPLNPTANDRLPTVLPAQTNVWQKTQRWWSELLAEVRSLLPVAINQRVSNPVLTATIALSLIAVLWTVSGVFTRKSPAEVAVAPAPPIASKPVAPQVPLPPELRAPEPAPMPSSAPESPQAPTLEASPTVAAPPEADLVPEGSEVPPETAASPPTAAPIVPPTPMPTPIPSVMPSPPLKLTPEQQLIASIQDQVAEISDRYSVGLIRSVQANFRSSRLTVNLGEGWYQLSPLQQDQLANEIFKRTQGLKFSKLELVDTASTLVARSPVVGDEMIVLSRSRPIAAGANL
jgi:hypothetical protein